jgi:hypothetical protein
MDRREKSKASYQAGEPRVSYKQEIAVGVSLRSYVGSVLYSSSRSQILFSLALNF